MSYTVDKVEQLREAVKRNRFGSVASLRSAGVTSKQHNVGVKKTSTKKTAKKSAKPAKKTAAKKTVAKKS